MKRVIIFIISLSFMLALQSGVVFATTTIAYPWEVGVGGNLGALVNEFYRYALGIAGAAAVGVIIYGAVRRMVSMGNPADIKDAKEWIKGALFGVVLLFGAYFIFYTINPDITQLRDVLRGTQRVVGGDLDIGARCSYRLVEIRRVSGLKIPRCPCDRNADVRDCPRGVEICSASPTCYDQAGRSFVQWSVEFGIPRVSGGGGEGGGGGGSGGR